MSVGKMCIRDRQNIMAEMLQEIQEKDEKLMCFQEQEERLPVSYTHLDVYKRQQRGVRVCLYS